MMRTQIRTLSKNMALTTFSAQRSRSMKLHVDSALKLVKNRVQNGALHDAEEALRPDAGNVQVTESADSQNGR